MNNKRKYTRNNENETVSEQNKKRLPAYKRQPDLYYSHVWLDREIYAQILTFIGWERQKKYSVKMAVRILLELGLKRYVLEQINLAAKEENRARAEGNEPTEPTDFIKDMRKKSRKMGLPPIV